MTCNLGGIERAIRVGLGIILLSLGVFVGLPALGVGLAYLVGAIALVTGVIGYCPAWSLFGINTCPRQPGPK